MLNHVNQFNNNKIQSSISLNSITIQIQFREIHGKNNKADMWNTYIHIYVYTYIHIYIHIYVYNDNNNNNK
jgi:hypothetical protein